MTTDELRAAAEMVVATGTHKDWYDTIDAGALAVCRAWLAEHAPDDAEPVTEGWARSAGAVRTFETEPLELFWWIPMVTFPRDKTFVKVSFLPDGNTSMGICGSTVMLNPTRGHVRRLCSALGHPLTEAP